VNCKFCSVGLNLGVDDADEKSVDEVLEVVRAARRESGITYVDFNTGHYEGDTYLDILEPYILRIKEELGLLIGVQTPPHRDLKRYDHLKEIGVNRVSFCFEIFDRKPVRGDLPGQACRVRARLLPRGDPLLRGVDRYRGSDEPWVTNGEIIAGLEPPESSIRAIDWITSVGAIPTVCVFRPLVGTDLEDHEPPKTEDMIPVFQHLYEACMEKGLPIGLRAEHPRLARHAARGVPRLLAKRYLWQSAKLAVMKKVFGRQFERKLRSHERAALSA
jgi:hypothetical protein